MNNGVFICGNCALIHKSSYPLEVSYPKSLFTPNDRFNYLQLRVLINGGNKNALQFYTAYDIDQMSVQKKYATTASLFYRNQLKMSLDSDRIDSGQQM
jgi:hypothetical protein